MLEPLKKPAFTMMLGRLQGARTDKFATAFVGFVGGLACLPGPLYPSAVVSGFDTVQPGIFAQLVEAIIAPTLPRVPAYLQRQALTGVARLIQDPVMWGPPTVSALPSLASALAQTATSVPPLPEGEDETMHMLDLEEGGFQASFTKLAAAQAPARLVDLASPLLLQAGTNSVQAYVEAALSRLATQGPEEVKAALALQSAQSA